MVARIRGSERERDNVPLRHYPNYIAIFKNSTRSASSALPKRALAMQLLRQCPSRPQFCPNNITLLLGSHSGAR